MQISIACHERRLILSEGKKMDSENKRALTDIGHMFRKRNLYKTNIDLFWSKENLDFSENFRLLVLT